MIGHAWNHGADGELRNTDDQTGDVDAARDVLTTNTAMPTLGWVAENDDPDRCAFPDRCRA